jgi:hypothetical protein
MVLHALDDLDAKLAMAGDALAADQEPGNWTRFHRLLERHLYTGPDPLAAPEEPDRRDSQEPAASKPGPPGLFGE